MVFVVLFLMTYSDIKHQPRHMVGRFVFEIGLMFEALAL